MQIDSPTQISQYPTDTLPEFAEYQSDELKDLWLERVELSVNKLNGHLGST
jgi:hypothetical protein